MVTRCPFRSASALSSPPVARSSNTAVSVVNVMPVVSPPIAIRPAVTVPTHSLDVPSVPLALDMDCPFGWAEDVARGEGTSGVTCFGEQPTMSTAKQAQYTALTASASADVPSTVDPHRLARDEV